MKKLNRFFTFFLAFILSFSINFTAKAYHFEGYLNLYFIDVGQGDSILIQTPTGKTMLVDAGGTKSGEVEYWLDFAEVDKLDVVVATHPHEDHIGYMDEIIEKYDIGSFYMPKVSHTTQAFNNMANALKAKGIKATEAKAGVSIPLDDEVTCNIVAPVSTSYDDLNNYSAVIHLTYKNTSVLLTGDAETLSENQILAMGTNVKSDILKVAHHGSSTSSSESFLKAVSPNYAIISVAEENDYGHPHKETLDKLQEYIQYPLLTSECGTIWFKSNGDEWDYAIANEGSPQEIAEEYVPDWFYDTPEETTSYTNTNNPASNEPTAPIETYEDKSIETTVYVTKTGSKYHRSSCRYLKKSKIPISLSEAKKSYSPCSVCNP